MIALTLISVLGIALAVWLIDKLLLLKVCPVCAGGFLTWSWLIALYYIGYPIPLLIPAILMGGSVVGIMYQLEKRSVRTEGERMFFKAVFMSAGFLTAYALVTGLWLVLALSLAACIGIALWAVPRVAREKSEVEKRLEECC